jgi:hypothetical protein
VFYLAAEIALVSASVVAGAFAIRAANVGNAMSD